MKKILLFLSIIVFFGIIFSFTKDKYLPFYFSETEIVFVGDMMFDRHIRTKNESDSYKNVLSSEIVNILRGSDLAVGNLEGVINSTSSRSQYSEVGSPDNFFFTFPTVISRWLSRNNFKLVNLGNNHIDDYGQEGIIQTKQYLDQEKVLYFGQPNIRTNSIIKEFKGLKIGFVNYNDFGGKPIDKTLKEITEIKPEVDFLVVYTHWGEEYVKEPNIRIQGLAHLFVDRGADLVIGSHSHVIQNTEEYRGALIYYSLGNFIFDQYFNNEVSCGLMLRVSFGVDIEVIEEYGVKMTSDGVTQISECKN